MPETILVTGGAGFIGSNLCDSLLKSDIEVINLDNFNDYYNPSLKERNITEASNHHLYHLYRGDILDNRLLDRIFENHRISNIIHLAALAGVRNSLKHPLDYIDVDIKGTVNMLEYARKYEVKRFLFSSSSSIYGDSSLPFREDCCNDFPPSPYAAAKLSGEQFCHIYHELYGISIGCLRFFTVYGPRQRPEMAISYFTRQIDCGLEVPVYGKGDSKRDYTYVDDIVAGILCALKVPFSFEVFNLGNSHAKSLHEVIETIAEALDKKVTIRYEPVQPGDVRETWADLTHSFEILGYRPMVPFKEGINRFIEWYRFTNNL